MFGLARRALTALVLSMSPSRRPQSGFSYLWTLMLVGTLSVGMVVTSELYSVTLKRERERQLLFIGHEFREAIRSYYDFGVAGAKEYPQRVEDLLKDPRSARLVRHLRRIYQDPVSGTADWGYVRVGGRIVGVHSLSEAEPLKRDGFEPDDAAFSGAARYSDWVFAYPVDIVQVGKSRLQDGAARTPASMQPSAM